MTLHFLKSIATLLLLLTFNTVFGNLAICVHLKGPVNAIGKEIVGFHLWTGQGEQANQYRTVYNAKKTQMRGGPWNVDLSFQNDRGQTKLTGIVVNSVCLPTVGSIEFQNICPDESKVGNIYYGCQSSDSTGYCQTNFSDQAEFCKRHFEMGTDTIRCVY